MVGGNWLNNDNLYLKFGTSKATPEVAGEYKSYGTNRIVEVLIDLTTLSTSAASILSDNEIFPGGAFIERVELTVETAATGSSSTFKVGLVEFDRSTVPTNYDHAFINGELLANVATVGDALVYVGTDSIPAGSTHGGILIGTTAALTNLPTGFSGSSGYYLTAQAGTAVFTAGKIRVRIYYHLTTTISQ